MDTFKGETQVAKLCRVTYEPASDDVFITFRVIEDEHKKLVLQAAKRSDVEFSIRGETLVASPTEVLAKLGQ